MPTVVGVRLRFSPKVLFFDPADTEPAEGDRVVVETERGRELGRIVEGPHEVAQEDLPAPLKPVVRLADSEDLQHAEELEQLEEEAMPVFREMIEKHELEMKPVGIEYLFDGGKIVFYFSAEERVDFRALVRDLASRFKARIDMRQVGVRDEARMVGGIGHCGEILCCERFTTDFQPVSIRMAKEQDLPLNPLKISGLCGRLMCCLRYEFDAYKEFKSRAPKVGARIETPTGEAKVIELNTPKETATLRLSDGKTVKVPVSCMECDKGSQRPCKVGREALETAGASVALLEAALPAEMPADKPQKGDGRKKRSRKDSSGGSGDRKKSGGSKNGERSRQERGSKKPHKQKSGEGKKKEAPSSSQRPKASSGRRRRRRRRPPDTDQGGRSPQDKK